jgi:Velvet factor
MEGTESVDTTSTIGQPISFRSGPLAGRLIRCAHHHPARRTARPSSSAHPPSSHHSSLSQPFVDHLAPALLPPGPPCTSSRTPFLVESTPAFFRCPTDGDANAFLPPRYAVRDRRPLEPPPVLRLRLYEVLNAGTSAQSEVEIPAEYVSHTRSSMEIPFTNFSLVRRHIDAGPFVLTATLFFVRPPTREEGANRVNRRNSDTRPIGRSWNPAAHPTVEPIFPLNAIPDTDPRCANLDVEWRQTIATQNAYAATPSISSNLRHTAHLPREPAQVEREAPNTLMFGTSVVNCMKITAASGPEAALYFCLSVHHDLVAPFDSCD